MRPVGTVRNFSSFPAQGESPGCLGILLWWLCAESYPSFHSFPFTLLRLSHSVRKFSDSTAVRSHWSRPHNKYRHSTYSGTDRVRLNFFSKNRINRVLERELEHTITTVECSNEITITITITDKNYDYSNNYEMSYLTIFLFTLTTP